jgi:hypothetical protein
MKLLFPIAITLIICACNNKKPDDKPSTEYINSIQEQKSLFEQLKQIFLVNSASESLNDSIAFLILPLQASCPSCRKKSIDSIMAHINAFPKNHFVTIALNAGRKSANSFFREQNYEMPALTPFFQFDSTNLTGKTNLYENQPMIYYAFNQKVYKKVAARPSTVKEDLREFFYGYRKDKIKK